MKPRIALTGGIACGKSLLAKQLNELGVETIDADDIVHELVPEEERRRIADEIFRDPEKRKDLEARLHPLVRARLAAFASARTARGAVPTESDTRSRRSGYHHEFTSLHLRFRPDRCKPHLPLSTQRIT